MRIREIDLNALGFEKVVVSPEESGDTNGWYYYEFNFSEVNDNFCLISQESDRVKDDIWKVKLFETPEYEFDDRERLQTFIKLMLEFKKDLDLQP
jgi:hypothetical protein